MSMTPPLQGFISFLSNFQGGALGFLITPFQGLIMGLFRGLNCCLEIIIPSPLNLKLKT